MTSAADLSTVAAKDANDSSRMRAVTITG